MGCNSHLCIEYIPFGGYWHTYALDVAEVRDYLIYALMANVRNLWEDEGLKCISEPRGLPDNMSEQVEKFFSDYGSDGHSHSWLTPMEFFYVILRHGEFIGTHKDMISIEKEWKILNKIMYELCNEFGNNNVRLVFCFDN